ncbi:MAG TPA: glutathione S-transferase family protein [Nevskiaceae bacterium]|nr:glutathione S-transferase family protein [Nevskiaceae bacterium]
MAGLTLFAHPFSSYCQKALIVLYGNDTPFTYRVIGPDDPEASVELERRWPFKKFPVLVDGDRTLIETTIVVEYLDRHHRRGPRMIPEAPDDALEVRFLDRFFDNYVMTPMQKIVGDALRTKDQRDPRGVEDARATLDTAYRWADARMAGRTWAYGEGPTLADCAAAPSLFYADWAHPIAEVFGNLRAYRARLNAWAPYARCIEEARPFRPFFPLGAPDRD